MILLKMQLPAGTKIDICLPVDLKDFFLALLFFMLIALDKSTAFACRKQPLRLAYVHTLKYIINF